MVRRGIARGLKFFTTTVQGRMVAITAGIGIIFAFVDNVVGLVTRTGSFTCMIIGSLSWCPAPAETWSDAVGGPGGATFSPITCRSDEVLVGLFGRAGGAPFVFSMGPICATAKFNWRHRPISVSQSTRDGNEVGSNQGHTFHLKCPPNMVAVGYDFDSAVVNTNFGLHEYLVVPLKLRCANLPLTGSAAFTSVAQPGERQGNASHKPFQCPNNSVMHGIKGRAGQFVDAVILGCRHL